ncbi:Hemolysin activation/secretion protein [Ectothiorhodosinus mongolicus]|uniref:Hemolysin activation/secretion protein n=1 Tax=Ectothiorhodosinus mongolicus TaxID=233100 RepID=A0A1R3VM04_9GAMM|nr:ShlB/FhaC/HecB family hemolysin secretion/activation protein [Ectothiorhodosinus mongolicus]ULX57758.1 ShlB/FhaC/HecB family hemolysin secretion/activation protein [Ectothiorhodosinus mongolicus]SIT65621.1 Hemolysin activation/secretion protein [Ectothiorhodosinus mongolicus]
MHIYIVQKALPNAIAAAIRSLCVIGIGLASVYGPALAQSLDPAITLPEVAPPITAPPPSPEFFIDGGPLLGVEPGGSTFVLQGVRIAGNTRFTDQELTAAISEKIGTDVDFAALQEIANTISRFYRDAGYPFARAYLPAQDIQNNIVDFEVLEGKYGEISAVDALAATPAIALQSRRNRALEGIIQALEEDFDISELTQVMAAVDELYDSRMDSIEEEYAEFELERKPNPEAQAFLGRIQTGDLMESRQIERLALILDDIPGYTAVPVVRPGTLRGTGDLEVRMVEDEQVIISAGLDNHGSKASGRNRARVDIARSRNFVFGDILSFTGLVTDEQTWLTSFSYGLPLGSSGLRLTSNALISSYQLGSGEFAGLADGGTHQLGARLSYPLLRSQSRNITVFGGANYTWYENNRLTETEEYNITALPVGINFDWRDQIGGGAVTYGALTVEHNRITNDERVAGPDESYNILSLNAARVQRIADRWQALARLSLQYSDDFVDSASFISLGGANAVRGYPVGEFSGRRGAVFQGEVSYNMRRYPATPYVFIDLGQAERISAVSEAETRSLAGYGVGLRYRIENLNFDVAAAWDSEGGDSVAEPETSLPWIWFSMSNRF